MVLRLLSHLTHIYVLHSHIDNLRKMNSSSNIFDTVRQKVEIFSSKFSTAYFLAAYKRKQFFASSFQLTYFTTTTIKFRFLAETCFTIAGAFRRRAVSAICRGRVAMCRATPAIRRAVSAIQRGRAAMCRAIPAIRRADSAMCRAIPAIWWVELTNRQGIHAIQFISISLT